MKYKFYFFDFDYTLVNSEKGIVGCFVRTMEDYKIPVPDYDVIKATIGMPIEDAVAQLTGLSTDKEITEIQSGGEIGQITYFIGEEPVCRRKLVVCQAVKKWKFSEIVLALLAEFL